MNGIDLATILSTIPSGLIVLSADLRVLSANRSFLEMFDLSDDGLWGQPLDGVLPAAGLREWATEVLATGEPQRNIAVILPDGGGERILRISITRLQAPEQEGTKLLLIVDDLTGEERLRTAEQMSERRFQGLVQGVHAIIWEADAAMSRFSFVSRRAEEILGYPTERWLAEPDFWGNVIVHPEDRESAAANYRKAASVGTQVEFEYRAVAADGRVVWLRDIVRVVRDVHGQVQQIGGAMLDITDRKLAEESVRESEERYRRLVELSPEAIVVQCRGRVVYANAAAEKLFGAAGPDDYLGRRVLDFVHPDYGEIVNKLLRRTLRRMGEKVDPIEGKLTRLDGQVFDAEVAPVGITYGGKPATQIFIRDITERKRAEAQLAYLADHDALTGLFNRRRFRDELARQTRYAWRYGLGGAVLFLDMDNFKYVNDTLGHRAGDDLLTILTERLRERLRETDILARIGGDEFAVLLPQANSDQAQEVARQILQAIGHRDMVIDRQSVRITASIGIALFPKHCKTVEELLANADLAMYHAKEQGGNRICVYTPDIDRQTKMQSNLTWLGRIRDALERDRFVLHLQPIMDLRHNRVSQYEALLRMVDEGELIMPNAFLDVAERFGVIREIDHWVVRRAIHLIGEHQQTGRDLCLEVNLSGKSFTDPELLPMIHRELAATSIVPRNLVFELNETAAIDNLTEAQNLITSLKAMGCRFGLDDFGGGFSSFDCLENLPVDFLKIKGVLIRDLPRKPVHQHLVRAMVEVAHGLGKQTVAECVGVESEETLQMLREYGVDFAQGYHIGRPGVMATT